MATDPFEVFLRPPDDAATAPVLKPITVRLPLPVYRYLNEMAEHADLSRNAMAVQLIEWGVAYALSRLPDELRDEIGVAVHGDDYHLFKHLED